MPANADSSDADRLARIAAVAANYELDENLGDSTERAETILWLATRGEKGRDWGHSANVPEGSPPPPRPFRPRP